MTAPKRATRKFAFTGTNSSGKTTMALEVTARLKYPYGVLAECVASQDRKTSWDSRHFPATIEAHFGMIARHVYAETEAALRGDCDVVVCDRSVIDLLSIARVDHPNDTRLEGLTAYVKAWASTYDAVYYLPPCEYVADGKRPPDEFRLKTHASLLEILPQFSNVQTLSRDDTFKSIRQYLGLNTIKSVFAEYAKFEAVSRMCEVSLIVKNVASPVTSDVDVWAMIPPHFTVERANLTVENVSASLRLYFGDHVDFHVMACPDVDDATAQSLGTVKIYRRQA